MRLEKRYIFSLSKQRQSGNLAIVCDKHLYTEEDRTFVCQDILNLADKVTTEYRGKSQVGKI